MTVPGVHGWKNLEERRVEKSCLEQIGKEWTSKI